MTTFAQRAQATFPPAFVNKAQEGAVETPEGDLALERGQIIYNRHSRRGNPSIEDINNELGGEEGWFTMWGLFYCNIFANPRMNILFDTRVADTNVNSWEHGKRIGSVLLSRWYGLNHWRKLGRGQNYGAAQNVAHNRAKNCPMRPTSQ